MGGMKGIRDRGRGKERCDGNRKEGKEGVEGTGRRGRRGVGGFGLRKTLRETNSKDRWDERSVNICMREKERD